MIRTNHKWLSSDYPAWPLLTREGLETAAALSKDRIHRMIRSRGRRAQQKP